MADCNVCGFESKPLHKIMYRFRASASVSPLTNFWIFEKAGAGSENNEMENIVSPGGKMNYHEKIASLFLNGGQNKPVLILDAKTIPLDYSLKLSLTLFMIELKKPYQIKTTIFDDNNNQVASTVTPVFSSTDLDVSKQDIFESKFFSGPFSLTTPNVHFTSIGAYRLEVSLLTEGASLDTVNTYFFINQAGRQEGLDDQVRDR